MWFFIVVLLVLALMMLWESIDDKKYWSKGKD